MPSANFGAQLGLVGSQGGCLSMEPDLCRAHSFLQGTDIIQVPCFRVLASLCANHLFLIILPFFFFHFFLLYVKTK